MTSEIRRVRPGELTEETLQTAGMTRAVAVVRDGLWSGIVTTAARIISGWHHHGDNDTVIYVLEGAVVLEFGPGGSRTVEARAGDFLHVAARAIHRESNPLDTASRLVITRAGAGAAVVNVDGPDASVEPGRSL